MPGIPREQLLKLAKAGAVARIKELEAELDAILKTFPELNTSTGRKAALKSVEKKPARNAASAGWSPAARKAVSERMKKYWATRKSRAAKEAKAAK